MASKRGKGRKKSRAENVPADRLGYPVHAGSSAVSPGFLDETIAFWQPHTDRPLNREDAREIIHNVSGFFAVLLEWEKAERLAEAEKTAADGT
ncbi:hypothetical protein [Rhodopseudomonas sp.]|uniref:hypothetical protein n=1 Tax=Rhodopseudomonas sp. TaxID=1078 RepID=UPI0039E37933